MEVNSALVSREALSGQPNCVGKYKDFQYYSGSKEAHLQLKIYCSVGPIKISFLMSCWITIQC